VIDEWQEQARRVAFGIRRRALESTERQNGGYLIQACGSAEILATLYTRLMNLGPSAAPLTPPPFPGVPGRVPGGDLRGALHNGAPDPDNDRFFLSPAHYSMPVYAALIETGRLAEDALEFFNRDGSTVEMIGGEHSPGIEVISGSLAQALSSAIGSALARRLNGNRGHNWVLMSDGELQEGQTWEALQAAANFELDNLSVYLDLNGYQVDGLMDSVMRIGDAAERVRAFGWTVVEVDGHDHDQLAAAVEQREPGRPLCVLCHTTPWNGFPSLRSRLPDKLHFIRMREGEAEHLRADLRTLEETFA
jgi:transketolase